MSSPFEKTNRIHRIGTERTGENVHMRKKGDTLDMLNGPLLGKILIFALPLALTSLLQQLFNSADAAVVGQFVSREALAAVGATTPVINMFVTLFVGLSVGSNVVAAIHLAWNDKAKVQDTVHTSMVLAIASGLGLAVIGIVASKEILVLISTPAEVLDSAADYLRIYFLGMPFAMVYNFGAALLRSQGDTRRPLYALIISCAANLALDIAFVHMGWGIAGVAAATAIANAINAVLVIWWLSRERGPLQLHLHQLRVRKTPLLHILKVGVPAGIQGMVFSLSNVVIQASVNGFGPDAMAGSAAELNYECYSFFIISAFAQTAITFISQNYARGYYKRCKRIFWMCMGCAIGFTVITCAIFAFNGRFFMGVFTTDEAAIEYALVRLYRVGMLEFFCATYEVTAGALRGMGRSTLPAIITIIGSVVLRVVWVYTVFAAFPTFEMLMDVYLVTWVITGGAMLTAYALIARKVLRGEAAAERPSAKAAA